MDQKWIDCCKSKNAEKIYYACPLIIIVDCSKNRVCTASVLFPYSTI